MLVHSCAFFLESSFAVLAVAVNERAFTTRQMVCEDRK